MSHILEVFVLPKKSLTSRKSELIELKVWQPGMADGLKPMCIQVYSPTYYILHKGLIIFEFDKYDYYVCVYISCLVDLHHIPYT